MSLLILIGTYTVEYDDSEVEGCIAATSMKPFAKISYKINTPVYSKVSEVTLIHRFSSFLFKICFPKIFFSLYGSSRAGKRCLLDES